MGTRSAAGQHSANGMRLAAVAMLLCSGAVLTTACVPDAPSPVPGVRSASAAEKTGDMRLRDDAAPLIERWPALDGLESAAWMSGTTGGAAPGPTTYWLDAVVVLPPAAYDELRAAATEAVASPTLVEAMREHVPAGPFHGGPAADAEVSTPDFPATVAFDDTSRTVVLSAVFGG